MGFRLILKKRADVIRLFYFESFSSGLAQDPSPPSGDQGWF
jgi:hypothetical protein